MTLTALAPSPRPVSTLVVTMTVEGATTVITLRGDADLAGLPILADTLARVVAHHDGPVVVNLSETAFIDTAMVRALGQAGQFLDDRGRELTIRAPSRLAMRMLTLLGASAVVEPGRGGPAER